jgi:hypothetical protein
MDNSSKKNSISSNRGSSDGMSSDRADRKYLSTSDSISSSHRSDNDNEINNSTLRIANLEKEYQLYLNLYQKTYKNYLTVLNTSSSNPCEKYKMESKGVSQECYNKIWADQKCTTQAPNATGDWQKNQTYEGLVNDSYLWSTITDTDHRQGCYGDTTDFNTNSEPTYSIGKKFASLPGRTWWGTHGLNEGNVGSKEECESMCASDSNCTGATFNPVKRYCWTRGGDGTISTGESADIALVPKLKSIMIILDGLNDKLMSINNELRAETKKINPILKDEKQANEENQQKFDSYYNDLSDDKVEMAKLLNNYNSVDSDLDNQTLFVEQQNLSYRIWFLLACILFFITLKKMMGSSSEGSIADKMVTGVLLLSIVMLIFCLSKPTGFATLGLAVIVLVLYKLRSGGSSDP